VKVPLHLPLPEYSSQHSARVGSSLHPIHPSNLQPSLLIFTTTFPAAVCCSLLTFIKQICPRDVAEQKERDEEERELRKKKEEEEEEKKEKEGEEKEKEKEKEEVVTEKEVDLQEVEVDARPLTILSGLRQRRQPMCRRLRQPVGLQ
jgi:outer membrane biosynthesis protein TonB